MKKDDPPCSKQHSIMIVRHLGCQSNLGYQRSKILNKRTVDRSYTLAAHTVIKETLHGMRFTLLTSLLVRIAKGTLQTAEDSKKCKCCSELHFGVVLVVHCASFPRISVFIAKEL